MTIADPHAIPESEHDCHTYVTEADHAWDNGDTGTASALYHSLSQSHFATAAQASHAAYRVGLIALNEGDTERALAAFMLSDEPAAKDAARSIANATHDDPTPDPDVVPQTLEQTHAWFDAGKVAEAAGDWQRAYGLFAAAAGSEHASPGGIASAQARAGIAAHQLGDDALARQWLEAALPNMSDTDSSVKRVRDLLHQFGGGQVTATDDSPAAAQVAAGVQAYENGDAHGARTALEAALHLEGPDTEKGRAHYYLGAMDYQQHHYADARNHIEAAVATAPDVERGWAQAALAWRWDEHAKT